MVTVLTHRIANQEIETFKKAEGRSGSAHRNGAGYREVIKAVLRAFPFTDQLANGRLTFA